MSEGYGLLVAAMNALPKPAGAADLQTYARFMVWTLGSLKPTEAELAELTRRAGMRCRFRPAPAELVAILREIRAEQPVQVWFRTTDPGIAG